MLVFICGKASDNVENYKFAENDIASAGHKVINPVDFNAKIGVSSIESISKINIALLDLCDAIYILDGVENDPMANREIGYAMAKNMKFVDAASLVRNYEG